jgi:hypothetical protein
VHNKVDIISLSFTRHAEDVREVSSSVEFPLFCMSLSLSSSIKFRLIYCNFIFFFQLRAFLKSHNLEDTQIFAKVEDFEVHRSLTTSTNKRPFY